MIDTMAADLDELTGLATRQAFWNRLVVELAARHQVAVVLLDIEHLRILNIVHGYAGGDEIVAAVARRFEQAARDEGFVARVGGDEFVLLAPSIEDEAGLETLARRIEEAVAREPIEVEGRSVHVGVATRAGMIRDVAELALLEET